MKTITLIEGSKEHYQNMRNSLNGIPSLCIDTEGECEGREIKHLLRAIECFSHSKEEVMLVRFSGRMGVVEELGNETNELLIALSYNKKSPVYATDPEKIFYELINLKETDTKWLVYN